MGHLVLCTYILLALGMMLHITYYFLEEPFFSATTAFGRSALHSAEDGKTSSHGSKKKAATHEMLVKLTV